MNNEELKNKRRVEFEKLVEKERLEEAKRIKEQEILIKQMKKKEALKQAKEEEKIKKEQKKEELNGTENKVTFFEKLKAFYKKLTYNKNEEIELQAKKEILAEMSKNKDKESSRLEKPLIFNYIAKKENGEIERSSIEALSRVDVLSFLEAEGYDVYEIKAAKTSKSINIGSFKLKRSKLIFYLSQLSAYLKSGIALAPAVKLLDNQAKKANEKKVWRAVYYDLSMGDNLSTALDKRGNVFPKFLINMVKTAEMTGNLPETLDDMVDYYTESEATSRQMRTAMLYPAIITLFAIFVVTFILVWVVPQFVDIYEDLNSSIPGITKFVIGLSDFLKDYVIFILIGVVILSIVFIFAYNNALEFKKRVQTFAMKLPVFGNIIIYNEVTIFTKTFANLINHSVFITDSISVLSKITDNEIYKKLIYDTAKNLNKGEALSSAFKNHWAFPNIAYQMLLTGEKTGRLGEMMDKVSEYYQEQHRNIINQMKTLIEPILIVTLAVIVGGILLSVIIPMYGMFDAI